MNAFVLSARRKTVQSLFEFPMATMSKRKLKAEPRLDTTPRAARAELIAQAAQQQKALAKAELKAPRKTFKLTKRVAKKTRKKARQAASLVGEGVFY